MTSEEVASLIKKSQRWWRVERKPVILMIMVYASVLLSNFIFLQYICDETRHSFYCYLGIGHRTFYNLRKKENTNTPPSFYSSIYISNLILPSFAVFDWFLCSFLSSITWSSNFVALSIYIQNIRLVKIQVQNVWYIS